MARPPGLMVESVVWRMWLMCRENPGQRHFPGCTPNRTGVPLPDAAGLTEAIDTLVVAPHTDAVIEVAQQSSTLRAKLALALAELDRRREFDSEGYASMAAWCRDKLGWTNQAAHRLRKIGRRLCDLPVTRDAWMARELTDGQVEIIVAYVTDGAPGCGPTTRRTSSRCSGALDVIQANRAMQDWAARADAILDPHRTPRGTPGRSDADEDPRRPQLPQGLLRRRRHRDRRHRAAPGGLR